MYSILSYIQVSDCLLLLINLPSKPWSSRFYSLHLLLFFLSFIHQDLNQGSLIINQVSAFSLRRSSMQLDRHFIQSMTGFLSKKKSKSENLNVHCISEKKQKIKPILGIRTNEPERKLIDRSHVIEKNEYHHERKQRAIASVDILDSITTARVWKDRFSSNVGVFQQIKVRLSDLVWQPYTLRKWRFLKVLDKTSSLVFLEIRCIPSDKEPWKNKILSVVVSASGFRKRFEGTSRLTACRQNLGKQR